VAETTIAWGRGTKAYFAMDYRNKVDGKISPPHYGFWVEAPYGEKLYEPLAGLLFLQALLKISRTPDLYSVHFMKADDERITPENDYNAPFRFDNGWKKPASNEQMLQRLAGFGILALSMIYGRATKTNSNTKRH